MVYKNEEKRYKSLGKHKKQWITAGITTGVVGLALFSFSPKITNASPWSANGSESSQMLQAGNGYEIVAGDTLWSISENTNLNVQTLADLNGIDLSNGGQFSLPVGRVITFDGMNVAITESDTGEVIVEETISEESLVNPNQQPGESVDMSESTASVREFNGQGITGEVTLEQPTSENSQEEITQPQQSPSETELDFNVVQSEIVRLVNELRADVGVQPVSTQTQLTEGAHIRAQEQDQVFSHTRPDGTEWHTVLDEIEYFGNSAGENLAATTTDFTNETEAAQYVFDQWLASPGHYENMVHPDYNQIGVSFIEINGVYYGVQLFGQQ